MGGKSGGGSGGGSTGKVDYPPYLKRVHSHWLTGYDYAQSPYFKNFPRHDIVSVMDAALDDNPYSGISVHAVDPSDYIVDDYLEEAKDVLALFDPSDVWSDAFALAASTIDGDIDGNVASVTANFAANQALRTNKSISNMLGGLVAANAVQSSAAMMGMALIYMDSDRQVAAFESDLQMKFAGQRQQNVITATMQLVQNHLAMLAERRQFVMLDTDLNRLMYLADQDYVDKELDYDVKEKTWTLETFAYGGNLLGSIAGTAINAGTNEKKADKGGNALMGGLSGALGGATAGAMVGGPPGAAIGAVFGGVMGALG